MTKLILINKVFFIVITFMLVLVNQSYGQNQEDNKWTIRYNTPNAQELFTTSTSDNGFIFKTNALAFKTEDLYVYYQLKLDQPIKGLTFDYSHFGDAKSIPITLLDAAANQLWRYNGDSTSTKTIEIKTLKARGQLIFRIEKDG